VTPEAALLAERAHAIARADVADVPSPCISVCRMDAAGRLCEGCLRTLDEIAAWSTLSTAEKRVVWARIAQRAAGKETP
jgi:predicted Fe-S protein YdhL (DUF1289 family)